MNDVARLALKFSPATDYRGGSQQTYWNYLIPALADLEPTLALYTASVDLLERSNLHVHTERIVNPFTRPGLIRKGVSWLWQEVTLGRRIRRDGCSVLYAVMQNEALRHSVVPQVVSVMDVIPLIYPELFPITNRLWKFIYIPAIRKAAAIVAISENTKVDLIRLLSIEEQKIFVVPPGYAHVHSTNKARSTDKRPYLLFVSSSLYPYKNVERLLRAFAQSSALSLCDLVIVGKKDARFYTKLAETVESLRLTPSVNFVDGLTSDEIARLYAAAHAFVYPSLYEGFGIPPLEAMAHGVPVMASNAASIPEVCGDAAVYVDPNSIDSIRDGLDKIVFDVETRRRMVELGEHRCNAFSWRSSAEKILDICRTVANAKA